jgi:hypothetical protein
MKPVFKFLFALTFTFSSFVVYSQQHYFPDSTWQTRKPAELKMNAALIDSAISFAIHNETKTDHDLHC